MEGTWTWPVLQIFLLGGSQKICLQTYTCRAVNNIFMDHPTVVGLYIPTHMVSHLNISNFCVFGIYASFPNSGIHCPKVWQRTGRHLACGVWVGISEETATPVLKTGGRGNSLSEMLVMVYQIACCHNPKKRKKNSVNPHSSEETATPILRTEDRGNSSSEM
jgi:hypothetical protein